MYQTSWLNTTVGLLTRPGFAWLLQSLSLGCKVTFASFELTPTASKMSQYNIYLYMWGIKCRLPHERLASQSHRPVNQTQGSDGGLLMNSKRRPSAAPPHHCFPVLVVATCFNMSPASQHLKRCFVHHHQMLLMRVLLQPLLLKCEPKVKSGELLKENVPLTFSTLLGASPWLHSLFGMILNLYSEH